MRRKTSSGRDLPKNAINVIKGFFSEFQSFTSKFNFVRKSVFNMDETSIYLDYPSNYTYSVKGSKHVTAITTGASADGDKLPIFILVPRITDLPNFTPSDNVVVKYKSSATFKDETIVEYVSRVFHPHLLKDGITDAKLQLDSARFIIPSRLTGLLQPADVCWFSKFKSEYHERWNDWFMKRKHIHDLVIQNHQVIDLLRASFDYYGITSQYQLHSALDHIIKNNVLINYFVEEATNFDDFMANKPSQGRLDVSGNSPVSTRNHNLNLNKT
ncbi:Pogo transposable element with [Brachionus plicatilis]|uniref:Pogo transposable element with n=1 Tax=Brachionus plicatilis TaxID=10195 RepID=A0A3M7RK56_BRAPC|nr:Pogo transposable element with [Brachionus plicatilis]